MDAQQRVCLLRQYRYVADGWIWELPAGKLEPNEPPLETAKRELIEEAGISARHWESLGTVFSSPGVFSEVLHLFYAAELEPSHGGSRERRGHRNPLGAVFRSVPVGHERPDPGRQNHHRTGSRYLRLMRCVKASAADNP